MLDKDRALAYAAAERAARELDELFRLVEPLDVAVAAKLNYSHMLDGLRIGRVAVGNVKHELGVLIGELTTH